MSRRPVFTETLGLDLDISTNKPIFDDLPVDVDKLINNPNPIVRTYNVSGASMLIPVYIIKEHGFIDGSYFLYYEDADYCYNLRCAGVTCFLVTNSVINHYFGSAAKKTKSIRPIIHYYQLRSRIVFHRRHSKPGKYYLTICLGLVRVPMWLALIPLRGTSALRSGLFALLAVRDAILNRLGKTFPPEDYLDTKA